jgi:hypothetical protein
MDATQHYNSFCVLFADLKKVCDAGKKGTKEAKDILKKMYVNYKGFNDRTVKFMDRYTATLISLGFSFDEMNKSTKVDVSDLDNSSEVKVSGKYEFAKMINANKSGAIFNYNEYSKPYNKLPPEEFALLKKRTLDNIRLEQQMLITGQKPQINRQPKTWALPDNEKDW